MTIRLMQSDDLAQVISIWNQSVDAEEVVYRRIDEEYWKTKFEQNPNYDSRYSFVAEEAGEVVGVISGITKKVYLADETDESSPGYITCLFVRKDHRGKGIGKALVNTLKDRFRTDGKKRIECSGNNPINLDWIVPGTPGHDHNNAPGVDEDCSGYAFFNHLGFRTVGAEIAMYLNLKDYVKWDEFDARRQKLLNEGIYVGRYDPSLNYDYDGMCDRVGSEYWREALRSEIACHKENRPNTDIRFLHNGKIPNGPRPILVATCDGHIIAQTGPLDLQESGRGFFTGICTDPLYERRGIASVLFNVLMQEFIAEGAKFSTLFTGDSNHAQKIYKRAGFRVVRRWCIMVQAL